MCSSVSPERMIAEVPEEEEEEGAGESSVHTIAECNEVGKVHRPNEGEVAGVGREENLLLVLR
jgi:hypothetical protein